MHHKELILLITFIFGCQVSGPAIQNHLSDSPSRVAVALNSVVAIVEFTPTGLVGPTCTAFFISPRILATANHCVKPPTSRTVEVLPGVSVQVEIKEPEEEIGREILFVDYKSHNRFINNNEANPTVVVRRTTVIKFNNVSDIALLELIASEPPAENYFRISSTLPSVGSRMYQIGMPLMQFWLFTQGIISSIRRYPGGHTEIIHQAHVDHGSSGSPIFNDNGEVVGVTTAFIRDTNYIGYATTNIDLLELVNRPTRILHKKCSTNNCSTLPY